MEKNKIAIILIVIGILLCSAAGIYGYLNVGTKGSTSNGKYDVKIIYYLDEEVVDTMPKNTAEEIKYKYDRYACTNKVTGKWNETTWTFTPNKTADATCKVYFSGAMYQVNLNIANGTLVADTETLINKGKDGAFTITPTTGYVFDTTVCTNDEEIFWDETKNELTVKNIQSDTNCAVTFKLSELNVEISVTNGGGSTTKTAQYGTELTSEVTPTSGYGDPTITCTNEQTGTWSNNQFKIASVTKDTKCTVAFKLTTTILYTVTLDIAGGHAQIPTPQTIESGANAYFTLTIDAGYKIGSVTGTGCSATFENNLVIVPNVVKNTTCTVNIIPN